MAHRLVYHSTLGLREIKKEKRGTWRPGLTGLVRGLEEKDKI